MRDWADVLEANGATPATVRRLVAQLRACEAASIAFCRLLERWGKFDDVTKLLVALTASGSAVAGWALWNEPGFKYVWAILAGFSAVMSIVHATLRVPERLTRHGDSKSEFAALRIALETFRHQMKIFPKFSVDDLTYNYQDYRERYQDLVRKLKSDFL